MGSPLNGLTDGNSAAATRRPLFARGGTDSAQVDTASSSSSSSSNDAVRSGLGLGFDLFNGSRQKNETTSAGLFSSPVRSRLEAIKASPQVTTQSSPDFSKISWDQKKEDKELVRSDQEKPKTSSEFILVESKKARRNKKFEKQTHKKDQPETTKAEKKTPYNHNDWKCPTRGCRNSVPGGCYGSRQRCKLCGALNPALNGAKSETKKTGTKASEDGTPVFENLPISKICESYFIVGKDIYCSNNLVNDVSCLNKGMRVSGTMRQKQNKRDRYPWRAKSVVLGDGSIKSSSKNRSRSEDEETTTTHLKSSQFERADENMKIILYICDMLKQHHGNMRLSDLQSEMKKHRFAKGEKSLLKFVRKFKHVFTLDKEENDGGEENVSYRLGLARDRALFFVSRTVCFRKWTRGTAGRDPLDVLRVVFSESKGKGFRLNQLLEIILKAHGIYAVEQSLLAYVLFFREYFDIVRERTGGREAIFVYLRENAVATSWARSQDRPKMNAISDDDQLSHAMQRIANLESMLAAERSRVAILEAKLNATGHASKNHDGWLATRLREVLDEYAHRVPLHSSTS